VVEVDHVNVVRDAVVAVEGTLGLNPQGPAASVAARLTADEADIAARAPLAADWATGRAYVVGQLVAASGALYRCTTAHTSAGSFDGAKFAAFGGGGGAVSSVVGQTGAVTGAQIVADTAVAAALASKAPTTRAIAAGTGLTGGGDLSADRSLAVAYGTTAGTAAQGNDGRLSDARTPTAHAASHAAAGSDPVTVTEAQVTGLVADLSSLSSGVASKADAAATTAALAGKAAIDLSNVTPATGRSALGLGTAAVVNTGTANGTVPLLGASGTLAVARLATGTPDGTKFVRDDGTLAVPPGGGLWPPFLFGSGVEGDVTFSANVDLPQRDVFYGNLTINSGVVVRCQNFRIFVRGTLTLNGTITAGAINNAIGSNGGAQWGNGITSTGSGGANGSSGAGAASSASGLYMGSKGGNGGTSGNGNAGGVAGTPQASFSGTDGGAYWHHGGIGVVEPWSPTVPSAKIGGGSGGGSGGGDGTNAGGGGGSGAGTLVVVANQVSGTGTLNAHGGNGAAGVAGNAAGGGGVAGGTIILVTRSTSVPFALDVAGGTGGAGAGTGSAGSAGAAGTVLSFLGV